MWPIGSKVYPNEEQAAEAYDAHMFRQLGYRAILNFDAETYAVRSSRLFSVQARIFNLLHCFLPMYMHT